MPKALPPLKESLPKLWAYALKRKLIAPDDSDQEARHEIADAIRSGRLHRNTYFKLVGVDEREAFCNAELWDYAEDVANKIVRELEGEKSIRRFDREYALTEGDEDMRSGTGIPTTEVDPMSVIGAGRNTRIEGRSPSERYSEKRYAAKHAKFGFTLKDERGEERMLPSQREYAKAGALFKFRAARSGLPCALNEHEKQLVQECFDDAWCGEIGGQEYASIEGSRVKTLYSDATSGGLYLNPTWFDAAITLFPLLNGELVPYVDIVDMPRGESVQSGSIGNPTLTWSSAAGDAGGLTAFDTTALVAALNTTIYPCAVALTIGRDFLSDAAVNVGQALLTAIGQRLASELDRVVAYGSGSSEPQGIFFASGTTTVSNASPSPTGWDVVDIENMVRSVPKQYRETQSPSIRWISNDTSYFRVRGLQVSSSDQRRIFGLTHEDYRVLNRPWSVQNNIPNTKVAFGDLSKYRLYRRLGSEIRFSDQGQTLMLNNQAVLMLRARYGGRVMDGNAFSVMTTAPA